MLSPVKIVCLPLRIVADRIVCSRELHGEGSVRFNVRLVNYVDADLIAHLKKIRIRRIMRSPYCIYVVLLADEHIALDLLRSHCVSVYRTCVVMVDTVQLDLPSVDQEDVTFDRYCAESGPLMNALTCCLVIDIVENRLLGVPLCHIEPLKDCLSSIILRPDRLCNLYAVALKSKCHLIVSIHLGLQPGSISVRSLFTGKINIPDAVSVLDPQQHIAEYAVVAEHVLTFKIRAVAPPAHYDHELVFTLVNEM